MKCYVCLIEGRNAANNPITQVNGTLVCYEHLRRIANSSVLAV